jgi:hypothetical protein
MLHVSDTSNKNPFSVDFIFPFSCVSSATSFRSGSFPFLDSKLRKMAAIALVSLCIASVVDASPEIRPVEDYQQMNKRAGTTTKAAAKTTTKKTTAKSKWNCRIMPDVDLK